MRRRKFSRSLEVPVQGVQISQLSVDRSQLPPLLVGNSGSLMTTLETGRTVGAHLGRSRDSSTRI